jgi:HSP20 family molecular chaperone IbpA
MHTIIHPIKPNTHRFTDAAEEFRAPHYDCVQMGDELKLVVFVPGVAASGVEITQRGPDLIVTARKAHVVRVNWKALHLEGAQRDYQLRLRLGRHLDYDALRAEIVDGVLTISLPKINADSVAERARRVA